MTVPARLETYTTDVEIKVDDSQIYVDQIALRVPWIDYINGCMPKIMMIYTYFKCDNLGAKCFIGRLQQLATNVRHLRLMLICFRLII